MTPITCIQCHQPYPKDHIPHVCPHCGGIFDFDAHPPFDPARVEPDLPGYWPYRHSFGLPEKAPIISLGEGNTPLVWGEAFGYEVGFKLENLNPTGSFKDRGTALLVSFLRSRGVSSAVEDSSGNAGASFAAYAARAGIEAQIFVPAYAAGPKREQIAHYGARVTPIPGPRIRATEAVLEEAAQGQVYASHAYLPHGIAGMATVAYELHAQLGQPPGTVILPVGHGTLLLGLACGFAALEAADLITQQPVLVGVQAKACAPLWAEMQGKSGYVGEGETRAGGVRIRHPHRRDALLEVVGASGGTFLAAEEGQLLPGRDALARMGFYVELTSALVWDGLRQIAGQVPEPIVAVLTGSGLKDG
ncbi:MAG: Threonine synthase [Chloroflexi bacterium]|nr:Threonine synthase [Chloroflexota bacterium]